MNRKLLPYMLLIVLSCLAQVSVGQWFAKDPVSASNGLKRYDVDGVAIGDALEEVVKKWGLDVADITEKGSWQIGLSGPRGHINSKIEEEKEKYRQLMKEWKELHPKRYYVKKVGLSAIFNYEKKLCNFDVRKTFDGNFTPRDVLERIVDKYGSPIGHRGIPRDIDEILSATPGSNETQTFPLTFYQSGKSYFSDRYFQTRTNAVLVFSASDHYLCEVAPKQANEELKEQLWKKYFPVEEKSDASDIQL